MTNTLTWNIRFAFQHPKINTNLLSVISLIVLCAMMFLTIPPVLADDCAAEHLAVAAARATLELAKANRDAAQDAVDNAEGFGELAIALLWVATAEYQLNKAEAAHDQALQDLQDCLNPPPVCSCGCGVAGCGPCGENGSGGCDSSSCSSGCGG